MEGLITYMGFDSNLSCNGFKYEVGKSYNADSINTICKSGFQSYKNPLDVLDYYPFIKDVINRYCKVRIDNILAESLISSDSKVLSIDITILEELTISDLLKATISKYSIYPKAFVSNLHKQCITASDTIYNLTTLTERLLVTGHYNYIHAFIQDTVILVTGHHNCIIVDNIQTVIGIFGDNNEVMVLSDNNYIYIEGSNNRVYVKGKDSIIKNLGTNNTIEISNTCHIKSTRLSTVVDVCKEALLNKEAAFLQLDNENTWYLAGKGKFTYDKPYVE